MQNKLNLNGKNDKLYELFIDLVNKVWVSNVYDDLESYSKDVLHMYTEKKADMKRNKVFLKYLHGELCTIEATLKVPDNCKYPSALIEVAQNQKQKTQEV